MLTASELGDYIESRLTRSAFRLEVLDRYEVAADGGDFARYLAGEPDPDYERKQPWLDQLTAEYEAGILNHRVHVLRTPLSDYLRYECEWGYLLNARAGEEIHIIDLAEQPEPEGLVDHDFWLVDDRYGLRMYYSPEGRFHGAEPVDDIVSYQYARDAALAAAQPFERWWNRHPEEWRANQPV
ncbi:hypothetical protein FHX37_2905 [Haloactinospora alba]|uniref:DUF6879 domain-containing protein n=1 Tax=Haloactinospora alba TaxID=405555 RepID=A0A543NM85_9ACTN|nr:DUF6879 family protein [Haloactinospora alba]TQN32917.1 hypothetical protein FHX37_2905 [Haloactinospora alba]